MGVRFPLDHLGKLLVIAGMALAVLGLLVLAASRLSLFGLGRLPGDLTIRGKNTVVYFPIVSSLVVSLLLTLLIGLISWLSRR